LAELQKAQRDLHFQMGRLRSGDLLLQTLDHRAQRLLQQAFYRLYQLLVAPIGSLHQIERLTIIPYGVLHSLPFHAFWTGEAYLIECVDCCYAPSASIVVHQTERAHAAAPMDRWSGLAVTDQGIPETAAEIKMVAPFFVDPQLYLGGEAGRSGLAKAAMESDILHISTHGLMRRDNPLFSALKLADGWIDVREIYRLNLRAQLVVLSACRSGFSQIDQGDELMGLVRGFLGAGAHTLLVSQWDVDDRYAPTFMAQFYQHLTQDQQTPVAALRRAQCQAIAAGHHPFWWAPFFVIG
jgi:CHAT domain-containing protein